MSGELQYLNMLKDVIENGDELDDRTGTGILSIFSPTPIRYTLSNYQVPCFTTKKILWKKTWIELLWFISGSTDSLELKKRGVNWWNDNTTNDFMEKNGLPFRKGEIGPIYGHAWRHYGQKYIPLNERNSNDENEDQGLDQLSRLIERIQNVKNGDMYHARRLILLSYNPSCQGVLDPCHMFTQFSVRGEHLDAILYQRSCDLFLGGQINVLSYSLLTHMIAKICGLKARYFTHHIGDAHVYKNHIEQCKLQMTRSELNKPFISFRKGKSYNSIDDFADEDLIMCDYHHHNSISAKMAI